MLVMTVELCQQLTPSFVNYLLGELTYDKERKCFYAPKVHGSTAIQDRNIVPVISNLWQSFLNIMYAGTTIMYELTNQQLNTFFINVAAQLRES